MLFAPVWFGKNRTVEASVASDSLSDELSSVRPRHRTGLSKTDAVAIVVSIVIGAGIFRTPSLVAARASSETILMLLWGLGGLVSLVGALCYAELASTYPDAGGDYHFLHRTFGHRLAFLFASRWPKVRWRKW